MNERPRMAISGDRGTEIQPNPTQVRAHPTILLSLDGMGSSKADLEGKTKGSIQLRDLFNPDLADWVGIQ